MEQKETPCLFCWGEADGAMLGIGGGSIAHVDCVIQRLNELLDPDWESGSDKKPARAVGFLAGYVKLVDDQSLPEARPSKVSSFGSYYQAQQDMLKAGWRKVLLPR